MATTKPAIKPTKSEVQFSRWLATLSQTHRDVLRRAAVVGTRLNDAEEHLVDVLDGRWKDFAAVVRVDPGQHVLDMVVL